MDVDAVVTRLRAHARVFRAQVADLSPSQALWRPTPSEWSILEVVCHLADEEVRDFRTRLELVLLHPDRPWPPIDPERWAAEEGYRTRALADQLDRFLDERATNVAWLSGLDVPASAWEHRYDHASLGSLTAGDLLASWLAHDLIHVRQINRLQRQYLEAELLPGRSPAYAGRW